MELPVIAFRGEQAIAERGADELLLELRFAEDVGVVEEDCLHVLRLAEIVEGAADPFHAMIWVLVHRPRPDMQRIGDRLKEPPDERQGLFGRDDRLRDELRRGQRNWHSRRLSCVPAPVEDRHLA